MPKAMKTGTTICGVVYGSGVVLGADTRATGGTEVCDKNCEKIHYLADNIYCCGAGTAADTENTTELISSQLNLLRMSNKSQSRVVTAVTLLKRMLYRYQGHISAALVVGGVDRDGPKVFQVYPHGSTGSLPYVTMGSGSLAAMSVFESEWKEGLDEASATELVKRAIEAGVYNDLGSGSNVDVTIIRADSTTTIIRSAVKGHEAEDFRKNIKRSSTITDIKPGTTAILSMKEWKKKVAIEEVEQTGMQTD